MPDSQETHYKLLLNKGDVQEKQKQQQLGIRSRDSAC